MYKFIAEKIDGHGNVTSTRSYEAASYSMAIHATGKTGDVTICDATGLHTPVSVGENEWHYVRIFDSAGLLVESLTFSERGLTKAGRLTGDRP